MIYNILVYLALLATSAEYQLAKRYDIPLSLAHEISRGAECGNMPLNVLFSVIQVESGFNQYAVGGVGEIGLMQVRPSTARMSRDKLFDAETNVCAGSKYLTHMYRQFGDLRIALAAYNAGPGRVSELLARGHTPTRYANRVLAD